MVVGVSRAFWSAFSANRIRRTIFPIDVEMGWFVKDEGRFDEAVRRVESGEIPVTLYVRLQPHQINESQPDTTITIGEFTSTGTWYMDGDWVAIELEVPYEVMQNQSSLIKVLNQIFCAVFGVSHVFTKEYIITR